MSVLRKIQRVGKRATKFQYTATYQSVVVECQRDKWRPNEICVSWSRRGRRFITKTRPWQLSPDSKMRGVVVWPEPETMEITVTLYKGPKDKSYETKEWEFAVIDVDPMGKRKVLAVTSINMVRYASSIPFDHDLHLRLKPVSRKIKNAILEVSLNSIFLREGKATDDDMISIASQMSISNLSTIGFLEDDDDDDMLWNGGRSVSPPTVPESVLSTDRLIKWSQEVVQGYRGVKITNMTTSWRNGLGFLAIIHYHRPDLLDYEMLSPTSVKENNRLAFEIARNLGISCPLTANMMLTSTVPDKLAVTSFVYQMNQYFTKAMPSAITRSESHPSSSQQSPSGSTSKTSPFDLSAFDRFTFDKLSPVASPLGHRDQALNVYSRHGSRHNSLAELPPEDLPTSPSQQQNVMKKTNSGSNISTAAVSTSTPNKILHSTPKEVPRENSSTHLDEVSTLSRGSSAPNLVKLPDLDVVNGCPAEVKGEKENVSVPSGMEDRELEFENLGVSEDSEPPTGSSTSLDEENLSSREGDSGSQASASKEAPQGNTENGTHQNAASDSKQHRKLPTIPVDNSPEALDKAKKEERRKRAKEMLKQANIRNVSFDSSSHATRASDPRTATYREKALLLLNKAIGPKNTAKNGVDGSTDDSLPVSDSSSTSLSTVEENSPVLSPSGIKNKPVETGGRSAESPAGILKHRVRQRPRTAGFERKIKAENVPIRTGLVQQHEGHNVRTSSVESGLKEDNTSGGDATQLNQMKSSEGAFLRGESKQFENVRNVVVAQRRPRSASASSLSARQRNKPGRALPTAKPVSDRSSSAMVRMAQQRQQPKEPELQPDGDMKTAEQGEEKGGDNEVSAECNELVVSDIVTEESVPEESVPEESVPEQSVPEQSVPEQSVPEQSVPEQNTTCRDVKRLESPSAWSQHNEDLSKDLLVTQSDYVKGELLSLQQQLQALEERAKNIEADIRNVMSMGNKEQEELLMQEWFGLLNKKNELIKRQIELNILEKEEDLEKRQFFLNRELRPLMEIPDGQKSPAQKEREAHLLKELLELIDERDKLERAKMTTERNTDSERQGFALAHGKASEVVRRGVSQNTSQTGNKDCVIS